MLLALLWALGTLPALAIRNGVADTTDVAVGEILPTSTHVMCTATLISRNAVLTSASCLSDTTPSAVFTFAPSSTQSARIVKIVVHPEFNKGNGNSNFDIAIGVLSKAQNRTWNFSFPTLATSEPLANVNGTAVGFGQTSDVSAGGTRNSGTLALAGFTSGSDSTGVTFSDGTMALTSGTGANQMICPGDTGGPLFVNNQLAGVASFVLNLPCSQAGPAFEVPVARLNAWIKSTLALVDPPGACETDDDAQFATQHGGCEDLKSADMERPLTQCS
jgi:secreted trypsin-like serine protease